MKKVILITGTDRSGSTLLDMMLGNSSNGFSAGEIYALFRPFRPYHRLKENSCFCNNMQCSFWFDIMQGGEEKVYENLFERLGCNFIVDSSKNVLWIYDQIKYNRNKNYKLIPLIIFKTPLEYAYSLYKRNQLKRWKRSWIKTHLQLFYIFDDFISVKYKELAENPASKLQSLCRKIGLDYFQGKENFWNNDNTHFLFGSNTVKKSEKHIYYEKQYKEKELNNVKNNIDDSDGTMKKALSVLEAYEVDSGNKIDYSIIKTKEYIKEFKIYNLMIKRVTSTPYYFINKSTFYFKELIINALLNYKNL